MFKTLTIAAFVATSIAQTVIEIPAANWLQTSPSLVQMQLYKLQSQASPVKWGVCTSQTLYDVSTGTASPATPIVGSNVQLNLDIIFNADVDVEGNYVFVQFTPAGSSTPIPLYAQDFPATSAGAYSAGDEYTDSITWLVPSFAPLGNYNVNVRTHGASKDQDIWSCLTANFDITA